MKSFAIATLIPLPLLLFGALWGGGWILAALLYLTAIAYLLDALVRRITPNAPDGAEFPAADTLSVVLALAHFAALPLGAWCVAGGTGLGAAERIAAFFSFGLFFGQISHPNAHELIHRAHRGLFRLGKWVYISLLFGHHTTAHRLVHHVWVATPEDPNSARLGESFYHFAPRAWIGSFRKGLEAENRRARDKPRLQHPYIAYVGGGLAIALAMGLTLGADGLLAYLALVLHAQTQLLVADYVQHYGLSRARGEDGRYEPVTPRHSWDAPHWFSSYLMLNAPRHSDHHAHPARPYPALRLSPEGSSPTLPLSLPAMATLAFLPQRWRRKMDHRARRWAPG
ncbi:alkane 1-monooxygenase [Rhodovulum imhoffii]|uniref:Alkane 1-monooxygenase n=1 Tax=Rhodovulum imhoffii TaxID=365340 RepID=A0A2T5BQS7_9RHOB|nr:alkane 1-monooxygenase [Rhodovulum imhoffii]MBK5933890.1 alkane 1-monooxygenase [Rhodovulum imhoffii]PTN01522.1 alkane 1-monooxygenase [Rhodovulum imhoffii]